MGKKVINVTRPFLPPLAELTPYLEEIWDSKCLTNNGRFNAEFCEKLAKEWDTEYVVTFSNGTQALIAALSCTADGEKGEIITSPFTFVATSNAVIWAGHKPVFVDIDSLTLNICPRAVESAITENTKAILGIHCYGNPCAIDELSAIANKHSIPLIFDAAHAFGAKYKDKSIFAFGDMSVASFHATKLFNTFEGGAVACRSPILRDKLLNFSNFGFQNETTISSLGLNAKMSEFNAALGLLQLRYVDDTLKSRRDIGSKYLRKLSKIPQLFIPTPLEPSTHNYAYFPIFIKTSEASNRDKTFRLLRENGYFVRKYFYPLSCDFAIPEVEELALKKDLSHARRRANEVLCLPIYPGLEDDDIDEIASLINESMS